MLGAMVSQFRGGKGPGTGNFSSSGIQPRSDLQVKERCDSVLKILQNLIPEHDEAGQPLVLIGSTQLCWESVQSGFLLDLLLNKLRSDSA